jgi:hypothetical protein
VDTKTLVGVFGAIAGTAFLIVALFRTSLPRQKRLMLAYAALCFYAFGALEYFGIVRLESLR